MAIASGPAHGAPPSPTNSQTKLALGGAARTWGPCASINLSPDKLPDRRPRTHRYLSGQPRGVGPGMKAEGQKRWAPGGGFVCLFSGRRRGGVRSGVEGADHCAAMTRAAMARASKLRRRRRMMAVANAANGGRGLE